MFLRPRMTRYGGHAGPYVWGGVTGVTDRDNPWLSAVQENTATRLVVSANSYDAEQRFLVNENPLSVRTALGVGLGSAGCAGPIFGTDKYGPAMWVDQAAATAHVSCTIPTLTSSTIWTIEGRVSGRLAIGVNQRIFRLASTSFLYLHSDGTIRYNDGAVASASASTVATLLGISDWDDFEFRVVVSGMSLDVDVRIPGGSWVSAISGATILLNAASGVDLYAGSQSASEPFRGNYYSLAVRDGDETAEVVAEFTPGLFVGGNRADGDTAVDGYGVTWTIKRPAATTDMPRVMVGRTEQYISLPGLAGEYVSTPDTAANSITGDIDIRVVCDSGQDFSPGSASSPLGRWVSGGDLRGCYLRLTSTSLQFWWSPDGTFGSALSASSTVAPSASAIGVRATLDVDNGASGHTTTFFETTDGVIWTQLGSPVTGAGVTSIYDTGTPWVLGGVEGGASQMFVGDVRWAEVYDGIDGTLVERIDAAEADPNSTTWTSSTSGATVTVNKSASSQYHATVVPPNTTIVQGDGVNDFAQVVGDDTITDFDPGVSDQTWVLDFLAPSYTSFRAFMSNIDATTSDGLMIEFGAIANGVEMRVDDGAIVNWIGDAAAITLGARTQAIRAVGDSDQEAYNNGTSVESATSALVAIPAPNPLTFFSRPNGTNPAAFDLYGAAVLGERTSDTEAAAYNTEGLVR